MRQPVARVSTSTPRSPKDRSRGRRVRGIKGPNHALDFRHGSAGVCINQFDFRCSRDVAVNPFALDEFAAFACRLINTIPMREQSRCHHIHQSLAQQLRNRWNVDSLLPHSKVIARSDNFGRSPDHGSDWSSCPSGFVHCRLATERVLSRLFSSRFTAASSAFSRFSMACLRLALLHQKGFRSGASVGMTDVDGPVPP